LSQEISADTRPSGKSTGEKLLDSESGWDKLRQLQASRSYSSAKANRVTSPSMRVAGFPRCVAQVEGFFAPEAFLRAPDNGSVS
jgi:hypothetical protein